MNKKSIINEQGIVLWRVGTLGWGVILTSVTLWILAFGLLFIPQEKLDEWGKSVVLNLSGALFTSGVINCSLELASQKQRRKDLGNAIKEIRDSSIDSILEELTGSKRIFDEIANHVIRQEYIRKNWIIKIRLDWADNQQEYLNKTIRYSYEIHNLSSQDIEYKIQAVEEKECYDEYPEGTKFVKLWYKIQSNLTQGILHAAEHQREEFKEVSYVEEKLKEITKQNKDLLFPTVTVEKPVKIPINSYLKCEWTSESKVEKKLRYPMISLINSVALEVEITHHPKDLNVEVRALHPNFETLKEITNDHHTKRWRIDAGILPGQGIQITWKPKQNNPL